MFQERNKIFFIIGEELKRFFAQEGVADRYAEKEFHIPDEEKEKEKNIMSYLQKKREEELGRMSIAGYVVNKRLFRSYKHKNTLIPIYKNPDSLEYFEHGTRAFATIAGNLYVGLEIADYIHCDMINVIESDSDLLQKVPPFYGYLFLLYNKNENLFVPSDTSCYYMYGKLNTSYIKNVYEEIVKKVKEKNPQYKISLDEKDCERL